MIAGWSCRGTSGTAAKDEEWVMRAAFRPIRHCMADQSPNILLERKILMKVQIKRFREDGKVGWALLWLLGVPLPVLLIFYLIRGH